VSVDIWLAQDIQRILLAAVRANEQAMSAGLAEPDPPHELAYHQGFKAALSTMALALGLRLPLPIEVEEQCGVAEGPTATDAALGFLASGGECGRTAELAVLCPGGEVHGGHRSPVV
jgi:hypothetical protein